MIEIFVMLAWIIGLILGVMWLFLPWIIVSSEMIIRMVSSQTPSTCQVVTLILYTFIHRQKNT